MQGTIQKTGNAIQKTGNAIQKTGLNYPENGT